MLYSRRNLIYSVLIFILLFILHLPFLSADPDYNISFSRDAFTDEGLYTSQVRNYLISGDFDLDESDATVKSPLFSLYMLVWLKTFGISLITARLAILIMCAVAAWFILRKNLIAAVLITVLGYMQYSVFHYTHFSLAEMLAVTCLFAAWSLVAGIHSFSPHAYRKICGMVMLVACACFLKMQYFYLATWPILFFTVLSLFYFFTDRNILKQLIRPFIFVVGLTGFFSALYYVCWYIPNRELIEYVLFHQTSGVFGTGEWFKKMIDFNTNNFFLSASMKPLTYLFLLCFMIFLPVLWRKKNDMQFVFISLAIFSWCLLELHKLDLLYLPGRYLVVTYFAMALFCTVVIKGVMELLPSKRNALLIAALLISWPVFTNVKEYFRSIQNRHYVLQEQNNFVKDHINAGCTVVGAWAPSLTWTAHVKSVPVWRNYFNDKNALGKYQPCIIISEDNEADSDWAWREQGVDPRELAIDSSRFIIRDWPVNVFVVK